MSHPNWAKPGQLSVVAWTPCVTTFGALMRQARVARGLSQTRLAKVLNVDRSIISRWEVGNRVPEPLSMRLFVAALDLTDAEVLALAMALWRVEDSG